MENSAAVKSPTMSLKIYKRETDGAEETWLATLPIGDKEELHRLRGRFVTTRMIYDLKKRGRHEVLFPEGFTQIYVLEDDVDTK